jgi:plasmid maintenance system antidote protein VapI
MTSPVIYQGQLYVVTTTAVFAINPKTGKRIWVHAPYGNKWEWIYSSLCFHKNRIFYGDTTGHFQCLDTETGKVKWRKQINCENNRMVNATAAVFGRNVITATNSGFIVCLDIKSGKERWRTRMGQPSTKPILKVGNLGVAATENLYFFNPKNGKLAKQFSWKKARITKMFLKQGRFFVTREFSSDDDKPPILLQFGSRGILETHKLKEWIVGIGVNEDESLLYIIHSGLLLAYATKPFKYLATILCADHGYSGDMTISGDIIYRVTEGGRVIALRHPPIKRHGTRTEFIAPKPKHPGKILRDDYIRGKNKALAERLKRLGWPKKKLKLTLAGQRRLSQADMRNIGSRVFGPSLEFWKDAQLLWQSEEQKRDSL